MYDDLIPCMQCDIELDFSGPVDKTLDGWAAAALRKLADRIEKGEFESGHHDVTDNVGKRIGSIYIDYYEKSINA